KTEASRYEQLSMERALPTAAFACEWRYFQTTRLAILSASTGPFRSNSSKLGLCVQGHEHIGFCGRPSLGCERGRQVLARSSSRSYEFRRHGECHSIPVGEMAQSPYKACGG